MKLTRRLDALARRNALSYWDKAGRDAPQAALSTLRDQRQQAQALRARLDRVLHHADHRLAHPRIGATDVPRPMAADWAWRPAAFCGPLSPPGRAAMANGDALGDELALFHDCPLRELTIRQHRMTAAHDLAPFGLALDVLGFEGSFLSLVLRLPPGLLEGLSRAHVLTLNLTLEIENPLKMLARLNIRHGPNTEQMVRELAPDQGGQNQGCQIAEYDLAYTKLNERRVESAWIDLILDRPAMNRLMLRDLTLSRQPRAEL